MTAEEIKELVSVEQVLSKIYGLETKKRMPCPVHNGTHDNFSIQEKFYHCFSCGASGDIFKLVQELSNVNFVDSKKILCEYFELPLGNFIKNRKKNRYEIFLQLEQERKKQEERKSLKKIRRYQEDRICQTLRTIRTPNGNSFLEKHLEGLLRQFEKKAQFYIAHDIHAHLIAILKRYKVEYKIPIYP